MVIKVGYPAIDELLALAQALGHNGVNYFFKEHSYIHISSFFQCDSFNFHSAVAKKRLKSNEVMALLIQMLWPEFFSHFTSNAITKI